MNAKSINIEDLNLSKEDSKAFLLEMISQQINLCKTKYHAKWLKDHTVSRKETDENIERLRAKRKEIENMFANMNGSSDSVDISFSISIKTGQEKKVETLEYS